VPERPKSGEFFQFPKIPIKRAGGRFTDHLILNIDDLKATFDPSTSSGQENFLFFGRKRLTKVK
jgi:hypothetical protein